VADHAVTLLRDGKDMFPLRNAIAPALSLSPKVSTAARTSTDAGIEQKGA